MSKDEQIIEIEYEKETIPPFPKVDKPICSTITGERGWDLVRREITKDNDRIKSANNWKTLIEKFFNFDLDTETQTNLPISTNKNIIKWNLREFKIIEKNNFLGGRLKYNAFDDFIENIDEKTLGKENIHSYYRKTKKVIPLEKESLTKLLIRSISGSNKVKIKQKNVLKIKIIFLKGQNNWRFNRKSIN